MEKSYYRVPEGFILNPFNFIHQEPEHEVLDVSIKETLQMVVDLDGEKDLNWFTHMFKMASLSYVVKGAVLAQLKFKKLYKHFYSNFDQYALDILHMSTRSVVCYIEAARVALELIQAGYSYENLPHNMSQAYAMSKYSGDELLEKWETVVSELLPHKRTAPAIRKLLNPPPVRKDELYTKIELPLAVYSKVLKTAYDAKLSVSRLLDAVFTVVTENFQKKEVKRIFAWILDLQELVSSNA